MLLQKKVWLTHQILDTDIPAVACYTQVFKIHCHKHSAKADSNLDTMLIWALKGSAFVSALLIHIKQHQFCPFLLSWYNLGLHQWYGGFCSSLSSCWWEQYAHLLVESCLYQLKHSTEFSPKNLFYPGEKWTVLENADIKYKSIATYKTVGVCCSAI